MKYLVALSTAIILQLFIPKISFACKVTNFAASGMKMKGVIEFITTKYFKAGSSLSEFKSIRKEVSSGYVVELLDNNGKCQADLYDAAIQADCSVMVRVIPTYDIIYCK